MSINIIEYPGLQHQQVMALLAKGMSAVCLAGSVENRSKISLQVLEGRYQVVFINPELLILNLKWREMLRNPTYQTYLVGIVIDEAHCVTKWYKMCHAVS